MAQPITRLSRALACRHRYKVFEQERQPYGAPIEMWFKWQAWVRARRGVIAEEIASAHAEKRDNQRREHERSSTAKPKPI